jgi:hypothetical protein
VSLRPPIAFSARAFPDASLATALSHLRWGWLLQHLGLLECWLRDPQEAV